MNDQGASDSLTSFRRPANSPGPLSAGVATKVIEAAGDIVLMLDGDGTISDAAITIGGSDACFGDWVGMPWIDTVTVESKPKIVEMLAAAAGGEPARWRQVNHSAERGDVPVRYLVIGAGAGGRLIAIGRDLREVAAMQQRLLQAQQSLERDYLRLRQTESRYRLLFDLAAEPVLIVDVSAGGRIREANPAAHHVLAMKPGTLPNRAISALVAADSREPLDRFLGDAARADGVTPIDVRLAHDGSEAKVSATLFRQERVTLLMVRLSQDAPAKAEADPDARTRAVVERMPDAFVLVDRSLAITAANAAFVELTQAASAERLRGASLGTWLGRPGVELDLLVGQMREHGSIRNFSTIVRGSGGSREEVEVSGVAAPGDDGEFYGFTIRSVARRIKDRPPVARDLPRSVEQLTELVGRMSLKEIVRESTDLIERLCIEAALTYTSDNRASAAEILGVSRQSLYSKLHRHGLGNLVPDGDS